MKASVKVTGLIAGCAASVNALSIQAPIQAAPAGLIQELIRAEIIPTVLDPFKPLLTVSASWKAKEAQLGNTIKPKKLQETPNVLLVDELPGSLHQWHDGDLHPQLTLVLTDPDAPSRDNPEWSQFCHWIATNIPLSPAKTEAKSTQHVTEIMPYVPPGPPKKTGKHRYVFVALAPANATTEPLSLSTPKDRKRWGYETERAGLREWAAENGLVAVGANFFYSQHKKQ